MGSLSDYAELELLDHIFGVGAYTPVATLYLALCTAAPTDASTGSTITEPAGGAYARTAITFGAAASRVITNSAQVTFPQATADWGTITHFAVCDAATLGNVLAWGALSVSKAVVNGNTASVAVSEVDITFSAGEWSDYAANTSLDFMFRNQTFTQPTLYVALTTATITDGLTGTTITECSGTNYARPATGAFNTAAAGATANTADINFATPGTGGWGTAVACCLCDATTAGNMLVYDNAMADNAIAESDIVKFLAGDYDVTLD